MFGLVTLLGNGRKSNSQHRFKHWHRSKERIARLSSESLGASLALIGEFRDKSEPHGRVQRPGIERPLCFSINAVGRELLGIHCFSRSRGWRCVGVSDDFSLGLGRAGSRGACTRVTTHSAPLSNKTGTHNRHRCTLCTAQQKHTETQVSCARNT